MRQYKLNITRDLRQTDLTLQQQPFLWLCHEERHPTPLLRLCRERSTETRPTNTYQTKHDNTRACNSGKKHSCLLGYLLERGLFILYFYLRTFHGLYIFVCIVYSLQFKIWWSLRIDVCIDVFLIHAMFPLPVCLIYHVEESLTVKLCHVLTAQPYGGTGKIGKVLNGETSFCVKRRGWLTGMDWKGPKKRNE